MARRLSGLTPSDQPVVGGGLGYRGFIISSLQSLPGSPSQVRVYKGILVISGKGGTNPYRDDKGVERWLLDQARKRGYGDIVDQLPP